MTDDTVQLVLEIPGWEPLALVPTVAMERGEQSVWQHSWCGTVVVRSGLAQAGDLRDCPSCDRPGQPWWRQYPPTTGSPLCGFRPHALEGDTP